jgi:hypothetical protein
MGILRVDRAAQKLAPDIFKFFAMLMKCKYFCGAHKGKVEGVKEEGPVSVLVVG